MNELPIVASILFRFVSSVHSHSGKRRYHEQRARETIGQTRLKHVSKANEARIEEEAAKANLHAAMTRATQPPREAEAVTLPETNTTTDNANDTTNNGNNIVIDTTSPDNNDDGTTAPLPPPPPAATTTTTTDPAATTTAATNNIIATNDEVNNNINILLDVQVPRDDSGDDDQGRVQQQETRRLKLLVRVTQHNHVLSTVKLDVANRSDVSRFQQNGGDDTVRVPVDIVVKITKGNRVVSMFNFDPTTRCKHHFSLVPRQEEHVNLLVQVKEGNRALSTTNITMHDFFRSRGDT